MHINDERIPDLSVSVQNALRGDPGGVCDRQPHRAAAGAFVSGVPGQEERSKVTLSHPAGGTEPRINKAQESRETSKLK